MASIDYVQALGAGAGFDTKKIVEALVNAERCRSCTSNRGKENYCREEYNSYRC